MECEFFTAYDLDFFFDDLLSAEGMLFTHTFFQVGIENEKLADIEKYGLYTYEEWSDILSYNQFQVLMGEYYKIYVGKGYVDIEYLRYMISRFLEDPHYDSNESFKIISQNILLHTILESTYVIIGAFVHLLV